MPACCCPADIATMPTAWTDPKPISGVYYFNDRLPLETYAKFVVTWLFPYWQVVNPGWFQERQVCPTCGRAYGDTVGTMPDGTMTWHWSRQHLAGYSCPTVVLHFFFPRGTADGQEFSGRSQHAYLPDDEQGRELLALFQLAFRRRVLFSLRPSLTTGRLQPTFSIHMKTSMNGGPARHGYPDPHYFSAALEELRLAGEQLSMTHWPMRLCTPNLVSRVQGYPKVTPIWRSLSVHSTAQI